MSFLLRVPLVVERIPPLGEVIEHLRAAVDPAARVDAATERALGRAELEASWFPWPRLHLGFFVPGASSRGVDVLVEGTGGAADLKVRAPMLASWSDWRLATELASFVSDQAGGPVEGPEGLRADGARLRELLLSDDHRWSRELDEDVASVRSLVVEQGRTIDLGGPHGSAWLGPRLWAAAALSVSDDDVPQRLIEQILDSVWARGVEDWHAANLLSFDGRTGREIRASVLAADQDTLLRDPEFVLLGEDLESQAPRFWLLPFDEIGEALPGLVRWLDDRTAAVSAIPRDAWARRLDSIRPRLVGLDDLLDGRTASPTTQPTPRPPEPPQKPWWKRW